jgi:hypothetical protein
MNFVREDVLVIVDTYRQEFRRIEKEKRKKNENSGKNVSSKARSLGASEITNRR